jgi:8-oxo-dGTP pyrophosphatase MutT (NUDIX family)
MSPKSSPADVRQWVTDHLDPLEEVDPAKVMAHSDFYLPPGERPPLPEGLTPAAVLVALIEREHGYSVLLTRRSDNLRNHTGQIALPGGRSDPGESPWQTALREAHEEVGLDPQFVALAGLSTPYATGSGYLITPVVGFVLPGFSLTPSTDEVADIFETPFGFLMDPLNHEEHEFDIQDGVARKYFAMTHDDRFIWGVTAGMLRALYLRLYGSPLA